MRKKIQLLFILLISIFYKSQDNSLAAAVNSPVSYQTGVPDISFPLTSLPAAKDFNINFGLAYNANAYTRGGFSGIIARNWMLTGSNFTITREVLGDSPDEIGIADYWDDTYYYNLNGEQGSFKIEKSGVFPNEIYKIIKLTPSNIIIESQRIVTEYSWEPRIVESFTVTDSKGYKYYFTDHDQSKYSYIGPLGGSTPFIKLRNTFYVTRVADALHRTIVTFSNKLYSNNTNDTWYYLPETVQTAYGSVNFDHGNSNADSGLDFQTQDDHYIKNIILKDHKGNFISENKLKIGSGSYSSEEGNYNMYRELNEINRVDKNDVLIDKIAIGYLQYTYPPSYGAEGDIKVVPELGLLNEIRFPSGKKIEYNFGFNKMVSPIDFNTPEYISHIQDPSVFISGICSYREAANINIDTRGPNGKKYILSPSMFLHSPKTRIYIGFSRTEWYPNGYTENPTLGGEDLPELFQYNLVDSVTGITIHYIEDSSSGPFIIDPNHNIYLEIVGTGGKGVFSIVEKDYLPPPYESIITAATPVLKNINYYDIAENSQPNYLYNTYDLKKSVSYDYNLFDGSGISSGVGNAGDNPDVILYKNLKIKESDKPGYSKYYFKTSKDYPTIIYHDIKVLPNYNLIKNGLLEKKEIYSADNIKMHETDYDYAFPPFDETKIHLNITPNASVIYFVESFFDKITTTDISKDLSGNSLTDTSERTFNQDNNNLMTEKKTSVDGIISETTYQYATEKNNTKLLGVGMTSVPLEVTQKQNNIQIGKLETKYDQAGNYFPSSVKSFGINNVVTGEQVNDFYDSMGNVLQTTSKTGLSTAIIWGYGGTQPIAKIEGGEYYNVLAIMAQTDVSLLDIVQKSNLDTDDTSEQTLRNALEAFRKKPEFKNFLITTYTYDPLIGVKSVTSPNGMTEYYFYDNQNRPIRVEDSDHHIIKENKYEQNVFQDQF